MLHDDGILLFRVVNPNWVENGTVTSLAFRSSRGRPISVFDGSMISPEGAFRKFSEEHEAYGVVGISVSEAKEIGMIVIEDRTPYPEHISLEFPQGSGNDERRRAKMLKTAAEKRGWGLGGFSGQVA